MMKFLLSAIITLTLLAGCATQSAQNDALYQKLGGMPGIDKMMGSVLDVIYADERIAFLFAETDRPNLRKILVEQLCDLSGGPCVYQGLDMIETHRGMELKHREFDIFVEDVTIGMENAGISFTTQNRVLALYAPMFSDVIIKSNQPE